MEGGWWVDRRQWASRGGGVGRRSAQGSSQCANVETRQRRCRDPSFDTAAGRPSLDDERRGLGVGSALTPPFSILPPPPLALGLPSGPGRPREVHPPPRPPHAPLCRAHTPCSGLHANGGGSRRPHVGSPKEGGGPGDGGWGGEEEHLGAAATGLPPLRAEHRRPAGRRAAAGPLPPPPAPPLTTAGGTARRLVGQPRRAAPPAPPRPRPAARRRAARRGALAGGRPAAAWLGRTAGGHPRPGSADHADGAGRGEMVSLGGGMVNLWGQWGTFLTWRQHCGGRAAAAATVGLHTVASPRASDGGVGAVDCVAGEAQRGGGGSRLPAWSLCECRSDNR